MREDQGGKGNGIYGDEQSFGYDEPGGAEQECYKNRKATL